MTEEAGLQYLHRRADGAHVWRVRPYVGTPRRRVTATFTTQTKSLPAARRKRSKIVDELEDQARLDDVRRPTIGKLLDDWLARNGSSKAPRTMVGYRSRAEVIRSRFGKVNAADLTPDMIDGWYHELRSSGTTEASLLEVHRVLSAALRWAYKLRRIGDVPTEFVEKPKHRPPRVSPPSAATLRSVLTELPDAEWARAVGLLALCGLRRGEVVGLRWEDVTPPTLWVRHSITEGKGQPVHVGPPKSRESREVELHGLAVAVFDQQRSYVENVTQVEAHVGWVFPDWDSPRLTAPRRPSSVSRSWDRYRKKHGGAGVRLHDLRHFYATVALEAGTPLHAVAAQLGHTDPATTLRIYGHATDAGRRAAANAVGAAIAGELG
jgi:integrase